MAGIVAYGTYVPYWRLDRKAIGAALGTPAGRGTRAVSSSYEATARLPRPGAVPRAAPMVLRSSLQYGTYVP